MNLITGQPLFIQCADRRIFAMHYPAAPDIACMGAILHIPAFGEEMNKSRVMVARQARILANIGYHVLVPDYYGAGDSDGEFFEATWSIWLDDMRSCLGWMQENTQGALIFWGLRLGALMAIELSSERMLNISRLVIWNPVLWGEQYMSQFLRLRLVSSIISGDSKERLVDLESRLEERGSIEVAGYELSNTLFKEIGARTAKELDIPAVQYVFWAELSSSEKGLARPATELFDYWCNAKLNIKMEKLVGSQFWATQEITKVQALIDKTTFWLERSDANEPASWGGS